MVVGGGDVVCGRALPQDTSTPAAAISPARARLLGTGRLTAEAAPKVVDEARNGGPVGAGAEVERACIENRRPPRSIDRHLRRLVGPELVRDDGEDVRALRRHVVRLVDLDPVVAETTAVVELRAGEEPRRRLRVDDVVRMVG